MAFCCCLCGFFSCGQTFTQLGKLVSLCFYFFVCLVTRFIKFTANFSHFVFDLFQFTGMVFRSCQSGFFSCGQTFTQLGKFYSLGLPHG